MTAAEILRAARDLISDPKKWTIGNDARSATGRSVMANSPRAVCWCAQGAVHRAGADLDAERQAFIALRRAARRFDPGFSEPFEVNDGCGHEATLMMFDYAIADLEKRDAVR